MLRKVSVRSVRRLQLARGQIWWLFHCERCLHGASGGSQLAEARFGGFVRGSGLKDFLLRKVSVRSAWRLELAGGQIWRFREGVRTEGFCVEGKCPFGASGCSSWPETRFGGFVRGSGLKDFLLRKVSVRSVRGLEKTEARFGSFGRVAGLKGFQ